MTSTPEPVAIVGMECLYPGSRNLAEFWRNIVHGVDCTRPFSRTRMGEAFAARWPEGRGGFLDDSVFFDPLPFGIMPTEAEAGDPEQFLVLAVVAGALRDAGGQRTAPPHRTEIVLARGGYMSNGIEHVYARMEVMDQVTEVLSQVMEGSGPDTLAEIRKRLAASLPPVTHEVVTCAMPNLTAGRVANRLNIMGRNYTVDAACASSLIAVDNVVRSLRGGQCDLGIAAAVHMNQKPNFWLAFETLGALSHTGACRSFSADADGLLIGEGLGALVLKRLADAQRDGDRIYALIHGVGISSDGRGTAVVTPRLEGEVLALRNAYGETGIDPQSVTLIEGHGTATAVGDSTEIDAMHAVFGHTGHDIAIGSVKSMIGHAMPAAGMAGLIKAALALHHKTLPPTCNVDRVHPKLENSRLVVNTVARPWVSDPLTPRRAGVNAFGFGGINAHAILEDVPDAAGWRSLNPQETELFVLGAESRDALLDRMRLWSRRLAVPGELVLCDAAYSEAVRFDENCSVRLAIVAKSAPDLAAKLQSAERHMRENAETSWQEGDSIFFASERHEGKLAVLFPGIGFPGLGGGYTTRLADLYGQFPEIRGFVDQVDRSAVDEAAPRPMSYHLFPPAILSQETKDAVERDLTWSKRSPITLSIVNMATWTLAKSLGLKPDAVAGFSLGEMAALHAGGVIDHSAFNSETLGLIREAMRGFEDSPEDARWAMVAAPAERVEAVIQGIRGRLAVTMDVSPTQVFMGGENDAVERALERFREAGIWAQTLPVLPMLKPYLSVHTELAGPFESQLKAIIQSLPMRRPQCIVYSGTTAQPYPEDPEEVRARILDSVTRPVHIRETLRRLYADGVRIFVQLGTGGKMLSNIQNTLEGHPHLALSIDLQHRGGVEQLQHMLGRLAVAGVPIDLPALFAYRLCRQIDPAAADPGHPASRKALPLKPHRINLTQETADWLRAQVSGKRTIPAPAPTAPFAQAMATMEQFLAAQKEWEDAESRLLHQFLEVQESAMCAVTTVQQPAPHRPLCGSIVRLVPGQELESVLVLNPVHHPFLVDHALLNVPSELRTPEDRLPTLPMTFEIEVVAEAAEALLPDLQVIAVHGLEAKRWIAIENEPTLEVTIRARRVAPDDVEVELFTKGSATPACRAMVTMGSQREPAPAPLEQSYERPCPHTASEFYATGPLFHGAPFYRLQRFHGMSRSDIGADVLVADPAIYLGGDSRGELILEPVVMDGLVHMISYRSWLDGWFVLPVSLKRISFHGPTPAPGTMVRGAMRYRTLDARRAEGDFDAFDDSGRLWLRMQGFQVWRVMCPASMVEANHHPRDGFVALLSSDHKSFRATKAQWGDMSADWMARVYLAQTEWDAFRRDPSESWLLGRIAAKDAIRHWVRAQGGAPLHPLEVELADNGVPITPPLPLQVTISYPAHGEAIASVQPTAP